MKLIIENWRHFVEQQEVITIDESLLLPEFLKGDLNEELLSEVETDPDALSLSEIEKMPPAEIIAVYDKLIPKQSATADQARAGRQKQRKQDRADTSAQIFKHDYSSVFNKVLNAAKLTINDVLGTGFEAFDEKSAEEKENLLRRKVKDNIMEEFSPLEREIIRSIFLFTGANVPAVREPKDFDEEESRVVEFTNKSITAMFKPTRETYEKAKVILGKLQQKEVENSPNLFRGLTMPLQSSKHIPISGYSVGRNINVGTFMSFTTEVDVSKGFSAANSADNKYVSTIFYVPSGKMKRGMYVSEYSQYEDEEEFITSGDFKITHVVAIVGKFDSLEEMLKNSKGYKNFEDMSKNLKINGFSFGQFFDDSIPKDTQEGAEAFMVFTDRVKVGIYMEQL
jgi:hypothetical protein